MAIMKSRRGGGATATLIVAVTALCCWSMVACADICQCGPRCAGYSSEQLCARCCTSVMRRRSVPSSASLAYPPPEHHHQFLMRRRSEIDAKLLAAIVEETAALENDNNSEGQIQRRSTFQQPRTETSGFLAADMTGSRRMEAQRASGMKRRRRWGEEGEEMMENNK